MRHRLAATALLALLVGCTGVPAAPSAVQPTLAGIDTLGFHCDEGIRDNVPSGLVQWPCQGTVDGFGSTVLVDGNQEGVAGITLVIDESIDPGVARAGFGRLVDAVPPLDTAPVLVDTLTGWNGEQRQNVIGGVRVSAECDATQCIVGVLAAEDPLRPLPLP
jgi:hypothetical protein